MSVVTTRVPATVVLVDDDDLSISGQLALHVQLCEALDSGAAELVVDLAGCRWFDVSALPVLLDAAAQARRRGVALRVAHCSGDALRLLGLAGSADALGATA